MVIFNCLILIVYIYCLDQIKMLGCRCYKFMACKAHFSTVWKSTTDMLKPRTSGAAGPFSWGRESIHPSAINQGWWHCQRKGQAWRETLFSLLLMMFLYQNSFHFTNKKQNNKEMGIIKSIRIEVKVNYFNNHLLIGVVPVMGRAGVSSQQMWSQIFSLIRKVSLIISLSFQWHSIMEYSI